ncbi:MAG: metallophosphoesterase, partial [Myxococcota bacterium]|nr:metallophosphoesterase [Myxococcota bacterium]
MRTRLPWLRLLGALLLLAIPGCTLETDVPELSGACGGISDAKERMACLEKQTVRLTVIHTGDIHSRILPYDFDVLATDERLGLQQGNAPFGGIARAAHVVKRIRANAEHVIHVDSGDVFQGAPIFNEFEGAPEILALNQIGMDAYIIGNHEFDNGPINLYDKLRYATFPVLAANYQWRPTQGQAAEPLRDAARPYTIIDRDGLKVGVIGMANLSSLSSISYGDGGLGITVLENVQVVQSYIDILRPQVNVIVCVTHLGLGED